MTTATPRKTRKPCRPCTPEEQALAAGWVGLATRLTLECWQSHQWLSFEEMHSEACLILVQCAQRWEESRGQFTTLVYTAVRRHLWAYCRLARRSRPLWSGPRFGAGEWPNADDLLQAEATRFLGDHSPRPAADDEEDLGRLREVRKCLGPREQRALALRYEEDRTVREVGESLGISRRRAGQLIARAQNQLRQAMRAAAGEG